MNTVPATYLEAAKIEELISELRVQGYDIRAPAETKGAHFDLLATRGEEVLAIEVKARTELKASAKQIEESRRRAAELGFTEYRLVVVNPPRAVEVDVHGLDEALARYMFESIPSELEEISSPNGVPRRF